MAPIKIESEPKSDLSSWLMITARQLHVVATPHQTYTYNSATIPAYPLTVNGSPSYTLGTTVLLMSLPTYIVYSRHITNSSAVILHFVSRICCYLQRDSYDVAWCRHLLHPLYKVPRLCLSLPYSESMHFADQDPQMYIWKFYQYSCSKNSAMFWVRWS